MYCIDSNNFYKKSLAILIIKNTNIAAVLKKKHVLRVFTHDFLVSAASVKEKAVKLIASSSRSHDM